MRASTSPGTRWPCSACAGRREAKVELSSMAETSISLPFITADSTGPKHLELNLTRLASKR